MTFFQDQIAARARSSRLIWIYLLAVAATAISTSFFLTSIITTTIPDLNDGQGTVLFLSILGAVITVIVLGTVFKIWRLRKGGSVIAEMLGGRRVMPNSKDPDERRVLNVVEEMAIASGMTVPPVFLLDRELGINAFAAGFSSNDAVIGVTAGAARLLSRDELQGVIAHEFSHIFHGDMSINLKLVGWLHGITLVAMIGYLMCRSFRYVRAQGREQQLVLFVFLAGLIMAVVGYIGMFVASLIKSAVSRQREYLADSSAVQYTRNPLGLAGALKKIAQLSEGSILNSASAVQASHLFFADGVKKGLMELFATHPPLLKRIKKLDPRFDGKLKKISFEVAQTAWGTLASSSTISQPEVRRPSKPLDLVSRPLNIESIGAEVDSAKLAVAALLLQALPEKLNYASHDPYGARAVICSVLIDSDPAIASLQAELLAQFADPFLKREVFNLHKLVSALPASQHLSLVALCVPALVLLPEKHYQAFLELIAKLVAVDNKITLFEHVLQIVVREQVERLRGGTPAQAALYRRAEQIRDELIGIIGALSYLANSDLSRAEQAFQAGLMALGLSSDQSTHSKGASFDQSCFEKGMAVLKKSSLEIREKALAACLAAVAADREVNDQEEAMMRAIGIALDCPIPLSPDRGAAN